MVESDIISLRDGKVGMMGRWIEGKGPKHTCSSMFELILITRFALTIETPVGMTAPGCSNVATAQTARQANTKAVR